jgi:hypothetical protein
VEVIAVIWSLWLCRNNKIFNDFSFLLQFIFWCTIFLCLWSSLQRLEDSDLFTEVSTRLEDTPRNLLPKMDDSIIIGLWLLWDNWVPKTFAIPSFVRFLCG